MAINANLNDITSGYNSVKINDNFNKIDNALQDALSRSGEGPNELNADLDMNGYKVINVGDLAVGGVSLVDQVNYAEEWANKGEDVLVSTAAGGNGVDEFSSKHHAIKASASASSASSDAATASASASSASSDAASAASSAASAASSAADAIVAKIEWQGPWSSLTAYDVNDAVEDGGSSYICTVAHTNQQPPNASFWDLLALKGIDGAGAGTVTQVNTGNGLTGGPITSTGTISANYASQAEAEAGADNIKLMTSLRSYEQNTARIASQAEAEAGVDNIKLMTPLRVSQAIGALGGGGMWTLKTSGTAVQVSTLDLLNMNKTSRLVMYIDNHSAGVASWGFRLSSNNGATFVAAGASYATMSLYGSTNSATTPLALGYPSDNFMSLNPAGLSQGGGFSAIDMLILSPESATKRTSVQSFVSSTNNTNHFVAVWHGLRLSAQTDNAIRFTDINASGALVDIKYEMWEYNG